VVLIFSRHFGLTGKEKRSPLTEIEINSCSRCGICLDTCQLSFAGGLHNIQSAYQLKAIRYNNIRPEESFNCLMCGRCESACPVGIDISNIRMITRNELNGRAPDPTFLKQEMPHSRKADVLYFAGCMTHQTPAIKKAMVRVLTEAGVNYWFMDESGGICCGRPMMLAGHREQAEIMISKNRSMILESGATTLVTSCPICYKVFSKEYNLNIKVVHHTQYLLELANESRISLHRTADSVVYHDPCELSRDIRLYEAPRELLNKIVHVKHREYEKENTLCCGNSLANFSSGNDVRMAVSKDALEKMEVLGEEFLVTSCPMCKKAFEKVSDVPVKDIVELVSRSLQKNRQHSTSSKKIGRPAVAMID